MSTIEGGMISTNNKKIYEYSRMVRSHGCKEIGNENRQKQIFI